MFNFQREKGAISIIMAILILSIILIIVLSMSGVVLKQIKASAQIDGSIKAYQAADSGIERALFFSQHGNPIPDDFICDKWRSVGDSSGGAQYCIEIVEGTAQDPERIKSTGRVNKIRRAVEVSLK